MGSKSSGTPLAQERIEAVTSLIDEGGGSEQRARKSTSTTTATGATSLAASSGEPCVDYPQCGHAVRMLCIACSAAVQAAARKAAIRRRASPVATPPVEPRDEQGAG